MKTRGVMSWISESVGLTYAPKEVRVGQLYYSFVLSFNLLRLLLVGTVRPHVRHSPSVCPYHSLQFWVTDARHTAWPGTCLLALGIPSSFFYET